MSTILLIEDDVSLGSTLTERLQVEGHQVEWTQSKSKALDIISQKSFDLLIIDVGLPDGNGFDVAKIASNSSNSNIIFLTAMNTAEDRLLGFELGAADFVPKPFHLKELLLRVNKVLSTSQVPPKTVSYGTVRIDFESMTLHFEDGKSEQLPARDFKLLELLVSSTPKVLSREEIMQKLWSKWGNEADTSPRTIDNAVVRLRGLLRKGQAEFIHSVRGVGYQWRAPRL